MKRTALAGLFVCAAMLASPVFAAEDLCQINLQKINDAVATLNATSENTKDDINALVEKAKGEQAAGKTEDCIATSTLALQKLQNLTKGGDDK
ncbi:hypothetical protein [Pseudomonas sp. CCC3.1]|uniref:hypothetical protein n=1 Tax=Pseudomonas sp. CCC3.1 TaxID=3048607 RepID=UPI002AC91120|nr:hypothetical protein [Pseudomonas sp. CCC3.1]MEB0204033.1 hypothetical protein [Pseudomonas sp. CCC3.1]WPX35404.1 hypothetical protein RHM56_19240 [Pseudomonas sp. CCC3.1]